jgi:hypothetical protein
LCAVLLANAESDAYSYSNPQWDSHINTNRNAKTHTNSEIQSNAAVSPYSAATPIAFLCEKAHPFNYQSAYS